MFHHPGLREALRGGARLLGLTFLVLALWGLSGCGGGGSLTPGGVASDRLVGGGTVSFTVDFGSLGRDQEILGSVDLSQTDRVVADLLEPVTRSPLHPQTVVQRQFGLERQTVAIQQVCPGNHLLRLCLQDSQGRDLWIDEATAVVSPGQVTHVAFDMDRSPTVALISPVQDQTVFGVVTLQAKADDDIGVTQVEFFVDGVLLGSDLAAPYQQNWNTATVPNGAHRVEAVARDTVGQSKSHAVTVQVSNGLDNPPNVSLTTPTQDQVVSGTIPLEATATDDVGVTQVDFRVEGNLLGSDALPPYQLTWDTTTVGDGVRQVEAVAHDTAGHTNSHSITVNVSNTVDNPPTADITFPTEGQNVSGTITVAVTATDDVGVTQVEFSVNGSPVGTDLTAPYQHVWDSTTLADGIYPVSAVARDTAGQPSPPDTVNVKVQNGPPREVYRVSVDSTGAQANDESYSASISQDGRFVAFQSRATNLVTPDANGLGVDILVRDRQTDQTTRVNLNTAGQQSTGDCYRPSISGDGRFVAFETLSSNLVAGDTNNNYDIFVRDRDTAQTKRVSVDSVGNQANGSCYDAAISDDGRFVAFESATSNLVAGDTNGNTDVFVHDRETGQTTRESVDSSGNQVFGGSFNAALSADGRFVAFQSSGPLVPGDTNAKYDAFVRDRQSGLTSRVSVDSAGTQTDGDSGQYLSISADGRYVAFSSAATNLVAGDTNAKVDIFVHDRQTGQTTRVSVSSTGVESDGECEGCSLSANGRFVTFNSIASNLVVGDSNAMQDVFVHDRQTGDTARLSEDASGTQADGWSEFPVLSGDGCYVAFESAARNLVPGDTNNYWDAFVARNILAPPAQAWDGAREFSIAANPNGPWSYGYCPAGGLGTDPTLFNDGRLDPGGLSLYGPGPWIGKNDTGVDYWDGANRIIIKPGEMYLHPGPTGSYAVLRWTAPVAGTYLVESRFTLCDWDAQSTDVHIRLNNSTALFDGICQFFGFSRTFTAPAVTMAQGDTLDFVVGYNGSWVDDSTITVARILLLR
ncbi:MAG: hypothetical protein HY319_20090 [Armatimonadetes bacterium]|nr:hypothetical protein [Armatimonadota bacterium]